MNPIYLKIVTPERVLSETKARSISIPTKLGQVTILPNHLPLVATLVPGEIIIRKENGEEDVYVDGGFLQVEAKNIVNILADAGERVEEINLQMAEEARKRAEEALKKPNLSDEEYALTISALERSLSRIRVSRKRSHTRTSPITGEGVFTE